MHGWKHGVNGELCWDIEIRGSCLGLGFLVIRWEDDIFSEILLNFPSGNLNSLQV